jgi:hypothetical protein
MSGVRCLFMDVCLLLASQKLSACLPCSVYFITYAICWLAIYILTPAFLSLSTRTFPTPIASLAQDGRGLHLHGYDPSVSPPPTRNRGLCGALDHRGLLLTRGCLPHSRGLRLPARPAIHRAMEQWRRGSVLGGVQHTV